MLAITCPDGQIKQYEKGTTLLEVSANFQHMYETPIVEGIVDGEGKDLQKHLTKDCRVGFIEMNSTEGYNVYVRSLLYTFLVALHQTRPEIQIEVKNTIGQALFCDIKNGIYLSKYDLADITRYMQKMIAEKEPIIYTRISKEEAKKLLNPRFYDDMAPLLAALNNDYFVAIYGLQNEKKYFFGPMLPNLGYLRAFDLLNYKKGIMLCYPNKENYDKLTPFVDQPKLALIYDETEEWGKTIGCPTVASLNQFIKAGKDREIIQIAEALHEKKIAKIADKIADTGSHIRLILIAGPSSSGKTTFAQRLSVQMRVNGLKPIPLSLDNYFKERKYTPRKPNGEYDFECLGALDLELFNDHLQRLLAGETVKIPHYNFGTGVREFRGHVANLGDNGVLVVEGIHGLNEQLSSVVEADNKIKIYISALTPLSFDDYNRIQTTDMRLMRRIVRDSQFRARDALGTLQIWPSVRYGEEKYIFPFSEEADVMFNTTLIYEFAVFKKYAEPLLQAIPHDVPEYIDAERLLSMLRHVVSINDEAIPNNSIMREFIGHSIFKEFL
ncbi:MAG: nucleoside kinase [Acidaminococcaceae bacterium]|nr:nucleoside kinase [Acidaminococcaceae bacterium]MDD4721223.1 nucleoside kinase [Acidaminococcaceae bacterium]